MPVISVGDRAHQFVTMRNGGAIKTELSNLAESLSTGRVTDLTRHLEGQTSRFSGIRHSLAQLDGYEQANRETTQMLAGIQTALSQVDALRSETSDQLLLISDASTDAQVDEAARAARRTFSTMVNTLNTRLADRSLMGGTNVDGPSLANADDMLANLQTAIGSATTAVDIAAAVATWFDDPAGGFATMGYQGDTGPQVQKRVSDSKSFTIEARADDPAIRDVLKAAALAAVAADMPGLNQATKSTLLQDSAVGLFGSSSGLVAVQSRVGYIEAAVDQTAVENTTQRTALEMSQNDLIAADPFETASRLQSIQLQLEQHYTVTARLSQLSLLRFI